MTKVLRSACLLLVLAGPSASRADDPFREKLLIGLIYVFVWEAPLPAYLDGVRFLSIRRYTLAVIHGLDTARLATIENPLSAGAALVAAAIVIVGFTLLAVRKLVRMDIP